MEANQTFKSGFTGWFVPDARMQEINEALSKRVLELTPSPKQ